MSSPPLVDPASQVLARDAKIIDFPLASFAIPSVYFCN
jgi:hypothetical protein